jgi:hypothetical protein
MKILTLIPDAGSYGIAILVTLSLGSFTLGHQIFLRWSKSTSLTLLEINFVVKALVVCWGSLIFPISALFGHSTTSQIYGVMLGIPAGWLAVRADTTIMRRVLRKQTDISNHAGKIGSHLKSQSRVSSPVGFRGSWAKVPPRRGGRLDYFAVNSIGVDSSLTFLTLVAVCEELLFRGFLILSCSLLQIPLAKWVALLIITLLFAASHISIRPSQAFAKLPLSVLATISVLCLGTVVPAIVMHVYVNAMAWKGGRRPPTRGLATGGRKLRRSFE